MEDGRILELENRIKLLEIEKRELKSKLDEVYKTIDGRVNSAITRKREEIINNAQFELHQYYSHYMDDNMKLKKELCALKKYIEAMDKCNLETDSLIKIIVDGIPVHSTNPVLHKECNFMTMGENNITFIKEENTEKCNLQTKSANIRNYNKKYDTKSMLDLYNKGLTYEQIAKEVGCAVRTIKRRFKMECCKVGYKKYKMESNT